MDDTTRPRRPRIVILGGGFGGAYCAQRLGRLLRPDEAEVWLLDRHNYFVFHPFLVEAGTGSLAPRHAVISTRSFLRGGGRFLMTEVTGLEPDRRRVRHRPAGSDREETLDYDQLVVALGSVTRLPPVPGLAEHGFEIKSLSDAIALRDRAIRMLEQADAAADPAARRALLHFVVVGGNFTGVEVAGEFQVFLRQASRRYPNLSPDDCRVTLVEIADRILPGLDEDLSRYAIRKMRGRRLDVRLETSVTAVAADHVVLDSGEQLPTRTVIWCAGIAPNPVLRDMPLPKDDLGYVLCERDLHVRGRDHVWALGDCAVNPDREGRPYPATAQHATRMARHLARNLARALRGEPARAFDYDSRGSLVGLGCRTGVAKVSGLKLSGFAAWFLWRTLYLSKLPGWGRRLRVALDWTMDLLFRRDYVQLGLVADRDARTGEGGGAARRQERAAGG